MDPVIVETARLKGQPVTTEILDDGKPLSADLQYVKITNGSATEKGVTQVEFSVNGTKFKQTAMKDNADYFLNIKSALSSVVSNKVTIQVKGKPGGLVTVMFADLPIQ